MPAPEDTAGTWRTPRHWSLRVKLAVVLLVPAVLALALGGLRITDQAGEAAELSRVARFAEAQGSVAELLQAVGEERYAAAVFVARDRVDPAGSSAATAETDARAAAAAPVLDALVADVGEIAAPVRQAEQALARLGDVRALVTTSAAPPSAVLARYSDILARLAEVDEALLRGVNTTEVNGLATALAGIGVARSEVTLQFALVSTGSGADPATTAEVQSSEARLRTGLADFRAALDPAQRVRYAALIAGAANTDRARLVQGFLAGQGDAGDPVPVFEAVLAEMDQAEDAMRAELITTSADRRTAATTLAVVNAVLLALALLLGALVVGLVARTMIVSLRTLRTDALDIARRRLPEAVEQMKTVDGEVTPLVVEPIDIDTREEIGEVARAFDAVHAEAVRLAAQQALLRNNVNDIFVNLSRRSQGLVGRQLRLIDELEKSEQDPEHLGNLFQLDHLATRMRRNNENLLVLAGAAELRPRRKRPVAAQDVLRAAVSEVEQYRRVTVRRAPDVAVAGPVVNDLVHLVAELLDNATTFSPPESPVVLDAAWGTGGRLVIEIRDAGVGIEPDELQAINDQLATPPIVDVAVSRRMGLFVVGRLAARHNIAVTLRPAAAGGGLLASVEVPAVYLQNRGPDEARPGPQERPVTVPEQAASAPDLPRRTPSSASASFGSRSFGSASTGSASPGSASPGPASTGPAPVGSAPVGSASARTASTDSTPAGSIGSASTGSGTPGSGSSETSGSGSFRPATPRPALPRPPLPGAGPDPAVPAPVADAAAATGAHALRAPTPPEQRRAEPEVPGQQRPGRHVPAQQGPPDAPPPRRPEPPAELPRRVPHRHADGPVPAGDPLSSPWDAAPADPDDPDLPIYGEMRSAWFRQRRFAPVLQDWPAPPAPRHPEALDPGATPRRAAPPAPGRAAGPPPSAPGGHGAPAPSAPGGHGAPAPSGPGGYGHGAPAPSAPGGHVGHGAPAPAAPGERPPAPAGEPVDASASAAAEASEWGTADADWRAARAAAAGRRPDEITSAGLPRRRPRAQLVPGSMTEPGTVRPPTRSPEMVRGRLSGYQQGLRQGREARAAGGVPQDPARGEAD